MSENDTGEAEPQPPRAGGKKKRRHAPAPSAFQKRVLWRAITGLSLATIAFLAVGAILVLGNVLGFLQPVLVPLALAGILAYLLDPVVRWARGQKFFGRDLSRLQAMGVVFFIAVTAMVGLTFGVAVRVSSDLGKLFDEKASIIAGAEKTFTGALEKVEGLLGMNGDDAPPEDGAEATENPEGGETAEPEPEPEPAAEGNTVSPFESEGEATDKPITEEDSGGEISSGLIDDTQPQSQLWKEFLGWLQSRETGKAALAFFGKAVNGFFGALGYIVGFFLVPIYLFFFLKDAASIRESWKDYVPLRASKLKDEVVDVLSEVNGYLIAYFRGQVVVSMIDGVVTGIILALMGLDYAIVIGVALAVLGVVPFVGFIVTAIPAVLIAAAQAQAHDHTNPALYPLAVALVFIAVQQIDGIFIQPKIVGESVGLHPLTVIFSVLFWSLLIGGVLGALLAVPLTAAVKVLFRRYIWEQKIRPNMMQKPPPEAAAG